MKDLTSDDEGAAEVPERTLAEKIQDNMAVLGVFAFLFLLTLLGSIIEPLKIWLTAIQVFGIMFGGLNWEGDQYLARGGKYRGCRILCQAFFILFPLSIGCLLVWLGIVNATARDDLE